MAGKDGKCSKSRSGGRGSLGSSSNSGRLGPGYTLSPPETDASDNLVRPPAMVQTQLFPPPPMKEFPFQPVQPLTGMQPWPASSPEMGFSGHGVLADTVLLSGCWFLASPANSTSGQQAATGQQLPSAEQIILPNFVLNPLAE